MNNALLQNLMDLLEKHTGLRPPPSNSAHLRRIFSRLSEEYTLSPAEFLNLLKKDANAFQKLLNKVMIGETYFFREEAHFHLLRSHIIPSLWKKDKHIICWSVSCSSGEEAISLAALLAAHNQQGTNGKFTVYASDINTDSLDRLKKGTYPRSSLRRDGNSLHPLLLPHVSSQDDTSITISPQLLKKISVQKINFFRDPLNDIPNGVDIIFFRNTLLYSRHDQRNSILARIVPKLKNDGILFMATSELPFIEHAGLRAKEHNRTHYLQKISTEPEATTHSATTPKTAIAEPAKRQTPPLAPTETAEQPKENSELISKLKECFGAINSGKLDQASKMLDPLLDSYPNQASVMYCFGWYHKAAGNPVAAIEAFDATLDIMPSFWLARFQRSLLRIQEKTSKSARSLQSEFRRCLNDMHSDDQMPDCEFLLEGFHTSYFSHMCTLWVEKLAKEDQL